MQCELYVRWFYIQSEYGKIRSKQPRIRTPFTQCELYVRWFRIQSENGKNKEQKKTDFGYFDPEWWWLYSIALLVLEINETENVKGEQMQALKQQHGNEIQVSAT